MKAFTLSLSQVYVGTYAKYNAGSLAGAWFKLSDYTDKDEFIEACKKFHADETSPEFMFQDWENIPEGFITESSISKEYWELVDKIKYYDMDEEALIAFLDYKGYTFENDYLDTIIDDFEESYQGEFNDEEAYAYDLVENFYFGLPELVKTYFDYERFARDLFIGEYTFENGYVFRCI